MATPHRIFDIAVDIADAHALGVHGDELVVKVGSMRLVLSDQLGIKGTLVVWGISTSRSTVLSLSVLVVLPHS